MCQLALDFFSLFFDASNQILCKSDEPILVHCHAKYFFDKDSNDIGALDGEEIDTEPKHTTSQEATLFIIEKVLPTTTL
jgi:hypothetical protein